MPSNDFDIDFVYAGSRAYLDEFKAAAERWEEIITADLPDVGRIDDLLIKARVISIDGRSGTLGEAGPTDLRSNGGLPYQGSMELDRADVKAMAANGTLTAVIMHEMGHVLGLGTLWDQFDFVDRGKAGYTGRNALEEYRTLSGHGSAAYVPLETGGGSGTASGHWSERVFGDEIMTGYVNGDMPISRVTIGALEDLGYSVRYGQADAFAI